MPVIPDARLPDDWSSSLLKPIGEVVIAAGQLEHVLDLSYKRLAKKEYGKGMQEVGDLTRCKAKTNAIEKAALSRGLSQIEMLRIQAILKRVEGVWETRNGVIHAVYAELPSGKRVRRRRVSKKGTAV